MRAMILVPLLLLPLTACMTERDKILWQEFKDEIASKKVEAPASVEQKPVQE